MQTRLSTKGRLTVPKAIRARHGWEPGTELLVEDYGSYVTIRSSETIPKTTLDQLIGCTGYTGPCLNIARQHAALARGTSK
jgi:AbrB family looped-hinge helix DNA binding protein